MTQHSARLSCGSVFIGGSQNSCLRQTFEALIAIKARHSEVDNHLIDGPGSTFRIARRSGAKVGLRREGLLNLSPPAFQRRSGDGQRARRVVGSTVQRSSGGVQPAPVPSVVRAADRAPWPAVGRLGRVLECVTNPMPTAAARSAAGSDGADSDRADRVIRAAGPSRVRFAENRGRVDRPLGDSR